MQVTILRHHCEDPQQLTEYDISAIHSLGVGLRTELLHALLQLDLISATHHLADYRVHIPLNTPMHIYLINHALNDLAYIY